MKFGSFNILSNFDRFKYMKKSFLVFILTIFGSSCVGGTLRSKNEFEEYPLRMATKSEGKMLKRCLMSAYEAQLDHREKTGEYQRKIRDLPIGNECGDLEVGQKISPEGFEIIAQFDQGESTVRWSINQDKLMEEHYEDSGEDMEFGF